METIDEPIKTTVIYPSLVTRVQSSMIDILVTILLMFAAGYILELMQDPPEWIRMVLFFIIWGVYEPLCTSMGCTLGQYFMKIRVVNFKDSSRHITIFNALIRYIFKLVLGWLSFLTISGNDHNRAIHDIIAGSLVIYKNNK